MGRVGCILFISVIVDKQLDAKLTQESQQTRRQSRSSVETGIKVSAPKYKSISAFVTFDLVLHRPEFVQHKPETIGQASRISGITPAAISLLLVHLKRGIGAPERSAA